jgi:hypothetical protein
MIFTRDFVPRVDVIMGRDFERCWNSVNIFYMWNRYEFEVVVPRVDCSGLNGVTLKVYVCKMCLNYFC